MTLTGDEIVNILSP